jgi:hypothetical protein
VAVSATAAAAPQPPSAPAGAALSRYRRALEALRNGDWQTFGAEMDALQKVLEAQ